MLESLSASRRNWALALIGALLLWFAWSVRAVLNPLIAGYFLAFVLHPWVMKLRGLGWSRRRSVNLIFLVTAGVATLVLIGVGVQAVHYGRTVADPVWREARLDALDGFLEENREGIELALTGFGVEFQEGEALDTSEVVHALREEWRELSSESESGAGAGWGEGLVRWLAHLFGSVFAAISFVVLLPIYTYFLLFELERIHAFVSRYIPWRHRDRISRVGGQIGEVLSSFFRGRLTVCLLKGGLLSLLLWVGGVKYSLLLGMLAGVASLLPFAGPLLAYLAAFLVALVQKDATLWSALLRTGPAFALAEIVEGYLLIPKILGESLGLHPVVVLLSVFVGAAAFGAFGVLLALPVAASTVILFREFVLPALARFADEDQPEEA